MVVSVVGSFSASGCSSTGNASDCTSGDEEAASWIAVDDEGVSDANAAGVGAGDEDGILSNCGLTKGLG